MMNVMDRRSVELLGELEKLNLENHHQSKRIAALECQISHKNKEIERMHQMLEKEELFPSMIGNCCSQCQENEEKIRSLEEQLKSSVTKQHEAMNRALHLAERNQQLERELKDIDNMALAVEAECQNKVKQSLRNMDVMEARLKHKIDEIKKLESTITEMRNKIERDGRELDSLQTDKKLLEKNLSVATNEKKNLTNKVNHFLIVEKNLIGEISRLQEINKSLQRKILDMEEKVKEVLGTNCKGRFKGKQKQQMRSMGSKTHSTTALNSTVSKPFKEDDLSLNDCLHVKSNVNLLDKLQEERNFYHNECHRLKEIIGTLHGHSDNDVDLLKQLRDQEREIKELKQEAYNLRRENCAFLKRFECGDYLSCSSGDSIKIILDRLEKERDMALSDISRLQGERDALKEKIKSATEIQLSEQSRLERIIMENEERIRRLESERREMISNQSSQRATLAAMEEKFDEYKEQARLAQSELTQTTANYNQLKVLQEQTDRTLSDVQGRLSQTGIELRIATSKIKELEQEKEGLEGEISVLKKEKFSLKASLAYMEKEKDGLLINLDEKTEKVAKLEKEIKNQETYVAEMTEKITHLEKQFDFTLSEKTTREQGLKALERTVDHLKEELEQCERQKEALIRENRRLQDDLASASKDCLTARRDLDAEKQEVENLKKQLQQYVTEVKRAEELLTKKETERNQMLDHFRSLSLEATALETNNHTLESTVENTKTQLMSAENKIMDLEHEVASKDSLLCGYEKQIADLTTQIAELETKLKEQVELKNRAEADLTALRDLCSAIDNQKEAFRKQANNHDAEKTKLMDEVRRLSEEYESLNEKLSYERSLSQTLEKSLSNSRQETFEHKINNKDLQSHVQLLRQKVDDLTQKLESESQDVRRYQAQCAELSQQVTELRREVTNARFDQAKAMGDSRRSENTAAFQSEEDFSYNFCGSLPTSSRTFMKSTVAKKRLPFTSSVTPAIFYGAEDNPSSFSPRDNRPCFSSHQKISSLREKNLPHTFEDDGVGNEVRFEAGFLGRSARCIPPLIFPEDSDRTISPDSDCDQSKNTLSRFDWKLYPLLEKSTLCSKISTLKADTASELSSLPEDSEPRDEVVKIPVSESDEKLTDFSAYPTYSVHTRSDSPTHTYNACERLESCGAPGNDNDLKVLLYSNSSEDAAQREIQAVTEENFCCRAQPGSGSDTQTEGSVRTPWRETPDEESRGVAEIDFASLSFSPSRDRSQVSGFEEGCWFQNIT